MQLAPLPRLTETPTALADEIFQDRVLPELGASGPPAASPTFVAIGGQQGAGKTSLRLPELVGQTVQFIVADTIDTYLPGAQLRNADGTHRISREMDVRSAKWTWELLKRAIERRYHVVFELAYPYIAKPFVQLARRYGYYTELVVLAVNRHISFTAVIDRYTRDTTSWMISEGAHQEAYAVWPAYLVEAENRGYFHAVRLLLRSGSVAYDNHQVLRDGAPAWNRTPEAFERLITVRNAGLGEADRAWLEDTWARLAENTVPIPVLSDPVHFTKHRNLALAYARDGGTSPVNQFSALVRDVEESRVAARRVDAPNFGQLADRFLAVQQGRDHVGAQQVQ